MAIGPFCWSTKIQQTRIKSKFISRMAALHHNNSLEKFPSLLSARNNMFGIPPAQTVTPIPTARPPFPLSMQNRERSSLCLAHRSPSCAERFTEPFRNLFLRIARSKFVEQQSCQPCRVMPDFPALVQQVAE